MGGQLDKRMLHWQPAKRCIFQLFIIFNLANKVLLLLQEWVTLQNLVALATTWVYVGVLKFGGVGVLPQ